MILSVTLNPAVDHILFTEGIKLHDTNRVQSMQTDAGGKGINLSRIAVELGSKSVATGLLGGGAGAFISHVLQKQGVIANFVETENETRTNMNVESGDGPPTTFNAKGPLIHEKECELLQLRVERLAEDAEWVALGGSLPPGVPTDAFRTLGLIAKRRGCKVVLDADGEVMKYGLEAGPDFIKPNVREAERLLDRELTDEAQIVQAAKDLVNLLQEKGSDEPLVVISRGKEGAILASQTTLLKGLPPQVDARSTIGSGDSLIGGMLYGLTTDKSLAEAFRYGIAAGTATATTDPASVLQPGDIPGLPRGREHAPASLLQHARRGEPDARRAPGDEDRTLHCTSRVRTAPGRSRSRYSAPRS